MRAMRGLWLAGLGLAIAGCGGKVTYVIGSDSGTGGNLITTVWVGKSDNSSLGYREYGGKAALPIWIDYMQKALKDVPIASNEPPPGMVKVAVTAGGQLLPTNGTGGIIEYVKVEDLEKMETYVEDYGAEDAVPSEESFDIF